MGPSRNSDGQRVQKKNIYTKPIVVNTHPRAQEVDLILAKRSESAAYGCPSNGRTCRKDSRDVMPAESIQSYRFLQVGPGKETLRKPFDADPFFAYVKWN